MEIFSKYHYIIWGRIAFPDTCCNSWQSSKAINRNLIQFTFEINYIYIYLVCFWSWFCIKDQRQFMFALELELNTKQNPVKGRIDLLFINFQDKVNKFQGCLPLLGCRLLFGCEQPLPTPACLFNKNFLNPYSF